VAWTLRNPAVNGAIAGFRRPEQVDPIVAAANLTLDKHDIATILRRKLEQDSSLRRELSPLAADGGRSGLPCHMTLAEAESFATVARRVKLPASPYAAGLSN
jgi:hypothetical protein